MKEGLIISGHIKKNLKYKTIAAQDIVKLNDNLLQVYKQLIELESSNPNFKEIKALEAQEYGFRVLRVFYVACTHISYGRLLEGYSLLINLENEFLKMKEFCSSYGFSIDQINGELASELKSHMERIGNLKVRAHVQILNQKNKEQDVLKGQIETMNLEGKNLANKNIYDMLKNPKVTDDDLPKLVEDIGTIPLIEFPPKLSQIPCKPIFLDIGYTYLQYPNLESKAKAEKKKTGFFGNWFAKT